jgi:hypothetical protein
MAEKGKLPYKNLKPLLNNAAFMVNLKGYDFICGSLKMKSNCEYISLGVLLLQWMKIAIPSKK